MITQNRQKSNVKKKKQLWICFNIFQKESVVTELLGSKISAISSCFVVSALNSTIWRYLTRELIWHLSQSFTRPSIYLVWLWIHSRIRSWNQPVLSKKGKVSCSRKQRGPLMGLEPTTSILRYRRATHCATPPLNDTLMFFKMLFELLFQS